MIFLERNMETITKMAAKQGSPVAVVGIVLTELLKSKLQGGVKVFVNNINKEYISGVKLSNKQLDSVFELYELHVPKKERTFKSRYYSD